MATVHCTISKPQAEVFAALVNPETYPHWLVGARVIRSIDDAWPAIGAAFHHRVGLIGPVTVADRTVVVAIDAPNMLELEVMARPFGRGKVRFELAERAGDEGRETLLTFDEVPLGLLSPSRMVLNPIVTLRNEVSLGQLRDYLLTGKSHRGPA